MAATELGMSRGMSRWCAPRSARIGAKRPISYIFPNWLPPNFVRARLQPLLENVGERLFSGLPARLLGCRGGIAVEACFRCIFAAIFHLCPTPKHHPRAPPSSRAAPPAPGMCAACVHLGVSGQARQPGPEPCVGLGYDRRLWDAEDRTGARTRRKKPKTTAKDYPAFYTHVAV